MVIFGEHKAARCGLTLTDSIVVRDLMRMLDLHELLYLSAEAGSVLRLEHVFVTKEVRVLRRELDSDVEYLNWKAIPVEKDVEEVCENWVMERGLST